MKVVFTSIVVIYSVFEVKKQFAFTEVQTIFLRGLNDNLEYVTLILGLSLINWGSESQRWRLCFSGNIRFLSAFKATLVGLGMSAFLPRLAGESLGRFWKLNVNKEQVVLTLAFTKVLMAIITLFFGMVGLFYFQSIDFFDWNRVLIIGLIILLAIAFIYFFKGKALLSIIKKQKYFQVLFDLTYLKVLKVFGWSVVRYFSFIIQGIVVVKFLGIQFEWLDLSMGLAVLYLIRMATISVNVFVDLTIRFGTAILIFQHFGLMEHVNQILTTFSTIWLVNVILPTICGGVLITVDR